MCEIKKSWYTPLKKDANNEEKFRKQINKIKDKDIKNPKAQIMAILYQDIEDNILMNARGKLTTLSFWCRNIIFWWLFNFEK
jgi:hypothetical protein